MFQRAAFIVISIFIAVGVTYLAVRHRTPPDKIANVEQNAYRSKMVRSPYKISLVDPDLAPPEIRSEVQRGFAIMQETKKHLPDNCGDWVSCNHCHFAGGNTLGGTNGGISLVGVTHVYPKKLENGKLFTLADRINGCCQRSLNGTPLPDGAPEMAAMITYLEWISSPIKELPKNSWLGLKPLKSEHVPNPERGGELFALHCAMCHGERGQGQARDYLLGYPPLWGEHAYNDGAGMNMLPKISTFIYYNMPYQDPVLTVEEALDIGSFVIQQPRPHYIPPKED